MSDYDVQKAVAMLQRHGLPVPMSDRAALSAISAFIIIDWVWKAGERNQPLEMETIAELTDQVQDMVCVLYKKIGERMETDEQDEN